ncbi:MAG TPA: DUF6458 family protein [Mycobacteriales bacterium]
MGIGVGILLIAVGAIMDFAITVNGKGFNIHTVGLILMIAGVLGILLELVLFMPRRRGVAQREVVVRRRDDDLV